jgi:cell division protein FtsL
MSSKILFALAFLGLAIAVLDLFQGNAVGSLVTLLLAFAVFSFGYRARELEKQRKHNKFKSDQLKKAWRR